MSTKILIVFICAAIGAATGFAVMKSYKRNLVFMESMCGLIDELKRNIAYRRDPAAVVMSKYAANSAQLKKNIDEYVKYVGTKDGALELSKGFLSDKTYDSVRRFFSSLGAADETAQLRELEMFGSAFAEYRAAAAEKSDKYGVVAVKLGFLFGLGVGVLTL